MKNILSPSNMTTILESKNSLSTSETNPKLMENWASLDTAKFQQYKIHSSKQTDSLTSSINSITINDMREFGREITNDNMQPFNNRSSGKQTLMMQMMPVPLSASQDTKVSQILLDFY